MPDSNCNECSPMRSSSPKFQTIWFSDLTRIPYIDEVSARATIDAMQAQGLPLPKVEVKALYDNSLLKTIEADLDRDKRR